MESVRVIKEFLNLEVGTILHFNEKSGRYEFNSRDEDTSPEYKSISEKSISLEPWLIADNIGKYFSELIIEENMKAESADAEKLIIKEPSLCVDDVDILATLENLAENLTSLKSRLERLEFITEKKEPCEEDKDVVIARIHAETAEKIAKINNS